MEQEQMDAEVRAHIEADPTLGWAREGELTPGQQETQTAVALSRTLYIVGKWSEEIDRLKAEQEAHLERIEAYYAAKMDQAQGRIDWLLAAWQQYLRSVNRLNPKVKSITVPEGRIQLKKSPDKVLWPADDVLVTKIKAAGLGADAIRVKEEPDKKWLKANDKLQALEIAVEPGEVKFYAYPTEEV